MPKNDQDEFIVLARELGADAQYIDAVPNEYIEYVLDKIDTFKKLITNAKYNAKYVLEFSTQDEIDKHIRTTVHNSIIQSKLAKEWLENKS